MTAATFKAMKETDESRGDTPVSQTIDTELFLDFEAGQSYWVEAGIICRVNSSGNPFLDHSFRYDGVLYDPGTHFELTEMPSEFTTQYENRGASVRILMTSQAALATTQSQFNDLASDSPFIRGMIWLSGRVTAIDAGRFGFWWRHRDVGAASPSTIFAGSWMYATPLDICPI